MVKFAEKARRIAHHVYCLHRLPHRLPYSIGVLQVLQPARYINDATFRKDGTS